MNEQEKAAHDALIVKLKAEVEGLLKDKGFAANADVDALKAKITELEKGADLEAIKAEVIKLTSELKALKEVGSKETKKGIIDSIKEWAETNKAALISIKAGTKAELSSLVVKVASPMTPSNSYNGSAYLPVPEIDTVPVEIVRVQPTFWDYITKLRTGAASFVWINKKNPLGAAGFIGPGVAKPGVSFEIATEISNAKKVAVSEKVATELLDDIVGMASWIQQELVYQLKAKINTTLMTGTVSSTVPAGIQTISVPYSLTTVKTTNPNHWDAIRACVAQLRSGNLAGPVTAFMNPIDYANMVLTKAQSQGQLFVPAETGAVIVEDNNVPVGYVQVALLDYYKVRIYKDITLAFGWEDDDFTKNLVTSICEMRLHQYFSENHTGAFIYDTFANIETAITTV
ncbi:MAG: phage major capsid protein [Bacteroidota bacterium]